MNDELAARHRAITLRLAGRTVQAICALVGRSKVWFHKWWGRYLEAGPSGLYDLTRANHPIAQRMWVRGLYSYPAIPGKTTTPAPMC